MEEMELLAVTSEGRLTPRNATHPPRVSDHTHTHGGEADGRRCVFVQTKLEEGICKESENASL